MKTKSRGLGKGLSALLSDGYSQMASDAAQRGQGAGQGGNETQPTLLPVTKLTTGRYQPRRNFDETALQELADSIAKNGIMQPILVRKQEDGNYEIVAGERRWRAAKLARLDMVPVLVRELSDRQALELAIVENVQRQDLSAIEEAAGYQRLMDEFGYTQEKVAATVGKSRSHVGNALRLLTLPESVKAMLADGRLSAAHGRALLGAREPRALAEAILRGSLNVRQSEALARGELVIGDQPREAPAQEVSGTRAGRGARNKPKDHDVLALEEMLSNKFGLTVRINDRGQAGDIILTYRTFAELDKILKWMGGGGV